MILWNTWWPRIEPDFDEVLKLRSDWKPLLAQLVDVLETSGGAGSGTRRAVDTVLVTGWRGVGKVALVKSALECIAWKGMSSESRKLYVTVPVRVPRRIETDALLRRILRKIYFTLSATCIGEIPELRPIVRDSRIAFLGASGESVEMGSSIRWPKKVLYFWTSWQSFL